MPSLDDSDDEEDFNPRPADLSDEEDDVDAQNQLQGEAAKDATRDEEQSEDEGVKPAKPSRDARDEEEENEDEHGGATLENDDDEDDEEEEEEEEDDEEEVSVGSPAIWHALESLHLSTGSPQKASQYLR